MGSLVWFIIIVGGIALGIHRHNVREKRMQDYIDAIVLVEGRWDQSRNDTGQNLQDSNQSTADCLSFDECCGLWSCRMGFGRISDYTGGKTGT